MLASLLEPTHGEVLYGGTRIRDNLAGYKKLIGYVPEEPNLYPYLSGLEYLQLVREFARNRSESPKRENQHAAEFIFAQCSEAFDAGFLFKRDAAENPDHCRPFARSRDSDFDEPLSGLDVTSALIFRNLMQELARSGKTILYSSHVLEAVEKVCSRVMIIYHGRLIADNSVERLRQIMAAPSLEQVFAELVQQTDTATVAREIIEAMKQK